MQRIRSWLSLFLSLVLWASLSTTLKAYAPPTYSGGDGSAGDPYAIGSKAELLSFMNDHSNPGRSAHYILITDVDLGGETWTPVGDASIPFSGSFNGDGHTISNLQMSRSTTESVEYLGLFGYCQNCKIMDLKLTNVDIEVTSNDASVMVGALVGYVTSDLGAMIFDIEVSGSVSVSYTNEDTAINYDMLSVGGVVGNFNSSAPSGTYDKILRVSSSVSPMVHLLDVAATTNYMTILIGGLVGYAHDVGLYENHINGTTVGFDFDPLLISYDDLFTSSRLDVGGLVGFADQFNEDYGFSGEPMITLNQIGTTAPVIVNGFFNAGGLIGYMASDERTYVTENRIENVTVTADRDVGGLVGESVHVDYDLNTLNEIDLTLARHFNNYSYANFGGFAGYINGSASIEHTTLSYLFTTNLKEYNASQIGGLIGTSSEGTELHNNTVMDSVILGGSYIGGLIGMATRPVIIQSKVLSTNFEGQFGVGGMIGTTFGDTLIAESFVDVDIDASYMVGGLVGISQTEKMSILRSFSLGSIDADQDIGGFIGLADSINGIVDSYSRMDIRYTQGTLPDSLNGIAESIVGGIIGYDRGDAISVYNNLYFAGTFTAAIDVSPYVGPIIGHSATSIPVDTSSPLATYSHLFYDATLYPGPNSTTLGVGLTTAQLMEELGYTGFDFDAIWRIDPSTNDGYAILDEGYILILFINEPDSFGYPDFAGSHVIEPTDPTKTGFIFGGWYLDEAFTTLWNFDTGIANDDVTLYAKWTAEIPNTGESANAGFGFGTLAIGLWLISRKHKAH